MMTDPIADLATRIRNANVGYHDSVEIPHSRVKAAILAVLAREGMVRGVTVTGEGVRRFLRVKLAYGPARERVLAGIRRISRPGLRAYRQVSGLPSARSGRLAILSTSRGLLTAQEARKLKVGGEFLLEVW